MTMSKQGECCDDCFEKIARENTTAARMWLELCNIYMNTPMFGLTLNHDNDKTRLLEHLGYITTTETPEMMLVKVHGCREMGDEVFFCIGACNEE